MTVPMTKAVLGDEVHTKFTEWKTENGYPNVQSAAGELIRRQLESEGYLE